MEVRGRLRRPKRRVQSFQPRLAEQVALEKFDPKIPQRLKLFLRLDPFRDHMATTARVMARLAGRLSMPRTIFMSSLTMSG